MNIVRLDNGDVILPPTAIAVKVTNILTPYIVRICATKDYEENLNCISNKLLSLTRGRLNTATERTELKIGNTVIIDNKFDKDDELPAWLCRGSVCDDVGSSKDTCNVLLSDYGTSAELQKDLLIPCPTDVTSEEYLSFTVGLYNVLPVAARYDSSTREETSILVLDEWSASAVGYAKELVAASSAAYFDHLVSDEHGRRYGELYLSIQNTVISLSDALVLNNYAIYLEKELLKLVTTPRTYEKLRKEVNTNNETTFYADIPREYRNSNEFYTQDGSYFRRANKFRERRRWRTELQKEKEKVLIYGAVEYECLDSILDARFPTKIHEAWKSLVRSSRPKNIQSYIWPAIKKGLDVVAIGPAKSGKTFGCGFAICGLLARNLNLPQGVNPSALILCPSSSEVLRTHSLCTELLQSCGTVKSVAAINGKCERSLAAEMFNGCQILISTPRFLVRFMDRNRKLLNFESLRYLILDDGDVILDKYLNSISKLIKRYKILSNREVKGNGIILQLIMTAKHWTPQLKKVSRILMDGPYICITSFIEATIFKSIHPKVYVMNSKSKGRKVLELLGDEYSTSRTVIICINHEEAEELHTFLGKYKQTFLAHENMNFLHLQGIKQCWDACVNGNYPALICTDEVLSDMHITNANWLIHYSISLRYKTQFNFRFSTLFNNLQMEKPNCRVTIIADENSDIQFLSIMKTMQRMNVVIPPNMLKVIEHIKATLDKEKENHPICNNIKMWGFCPEPTSCPFRHGIIPKIDAPKLNIQINDKVKFRIISVNNVNHISARMISHIKFDTSEETEFSNVDYVQVAMKIQNFYSCIENRKRCETIDVGAIYGLEDPVDTFKRVEILCIEREEKTDTPKFVDVRCIDNGAILTKVQARRLLYISEELIRYPSQVIEVFLVGIAPHDDEYVWNSCATDAVYQWFKENVDERSYVIGTVNLHLGNTIWVDTLEIGTKLIGYDDLIASSLKAELLKKDHAVEYNKHLSQMYQLCKDAGFPEINGCNLDVLLNKTT